MSTRKKTPIEIETRVLVESGRRCCICFGIDGDVSQKKGQIAHLDQDPSNADFDNLAYVCLNHHDEYDGRTRQSKGYTIAEVKRYRELLYKHVSRIRNSEAINTKQETVSDELDTIKNLSDSLIRKIPLAGIDAILFQKRLKANNQLSSPLGREGASSVEYYSKLDDVKRRLENLPIPDLLIINIEVETEVLDFSQWLSTQSHLKKIIRLLIASTELTLLSNFGIVPTRFQEISDLLPVIIREVQERDRDKLYAFDLNSILYRQHKDKRVIILVDSSRSVSEMLKRSISREIQGYETVILHKPEGVIDYIESLRNVFLVISGEVFSGMSGTSLAKRVKAIDKSIQFVLCTGFPIEYVHEKATNNGVDYILPKPFSTNQIIDIVRDALNIES